VVGVGRAQVHSRSLQSRRAITLLTNRCGRPAFSARERDRRTARPGRRPRQPCWPV